MTWLTEMPTEQLAQALERGGDVPENVRSLMNEAARRLRRDEELLSACSDPPYPKEFFSDPPAPVRPKDR